MSTTSVIYEPFIYGAIGLVGLASCFLGYKLFKVLIIALSALVCAGGLAWLGFTYGSEPVLWSVVGLVGGVVLGGLLAMSFYRLAVGLAAALFVALTLLPWVADLEIWTQLLVVGAACLVAAFLATAVTNLMIQLTSAMLGALMLVHSAMYFTTGQTVYRTAEGETGWVLNIDLDLKLAAGALVLGLIGFLVQHRSAKQ